MAIQRNIPRFCTRSICGLNLFQPLGLALMHLTKATCHHLTECFPSQVSFNPIGPALLYCWHSVDNAGPTVNQRWAGVSCLLRGEVFPHLMLFDIIFYHHCRCEIPLLKDEVYNRGCFRVIINHKR